MSGLIQELQRRNVFRVGVAYLALAWLVIQVTDMAVPALNLPDSLNSIVFYIGAVGFPFALFFAWAFELTPDGLKRSEDVPEEDSVRPSTGRNLERLALLFAVCALGFVVWDAYLREQPAGEVPALTAPSAEPQPETGTAARSRSIAVLPFVNMSDDKDYFADGLSEELLNLLARIPGLQVTGRTSSFAFKDSNVDLREIGGTLGVETVLEGSVRRSGDMVRITAQLINVADGFHIWSDTYDRAMTDIFAIQDEIAAHITRALRIHLDGASRRSDMPTNNLEAYALYLEAKPRLGIPAELAQAEAMLLEATSLDPGFGEAWIDLDQVVHSQGAYGIRPASEVQALTAGHHQKMFALLPDHPSSVLTRMAFESEGVGWREFTRRLEAFVQEHPGWTSAYDWLSHLSLRLGQFSRVEEIARELARRDPLYFENGIERGMALAALGQGERAQEVLIRWGDTVGYPQVRIMLALINRRLDDPATADQLLRDYSDGRSVELSALQSLIDDLLDPATRDAAAASQLFRDHAALPLTNDLRMRAQLYVFLDDPRFWEVFAEISAKDGPDGTLLTFLMGNYHLHDLLESDQYRQIARDNGYVDYWREVAAPEFCDMGHSSWTCELN